MINNLRKFRHFQRNIALEDVHDWHRNVMEKVSPYTMAGAERTLATIAAVEYIVTHDIPGSIVECGVWRGGQMMAAALTLQSIGAVRDLVLFDTFEGMTAPSQFDFDLHGVDAEPVFNDYALRREGKRWCEAGIQDVRKNLASTGYPMSRIHFIKGSVELTLPEHAPEAIAYLRLDTDWYESTLHEFEHLYPRVSSLGVVAIDDYGHWQGSRKATDEYLAKHSVKALLQRIDYSGRQFIKP